MDIQKFQEVSETENDVNPVIHIINNNKYFPIDLSSRPTGKKKKISKTPKKKKSGKKSLFFSLDCTPTFLWGAAETKYVGDIRFEGPQSGKVTKLNCKHDGVQVMLPEVIRLNV